MFIRLSFRSTVDGLAGHGRGLVGSSAVVGGRIVAMVNGMRAMFLLWIITEGLLFRLL